MQVLWEDLMRQNVIHVAFHSVCESKDAGFGDPWCTPDRLKAVLEYLLSHNWQIMTCEEFIGHDAIGLDPQRKYATISFDDGYRDSITVAAPILVRYGAKATFFIITSVLSGILPLSARIKVFLSKFAPDITLDEQWEIRRRLIPLFEWAAGYTQSGNKRFSDFCRDGRLNEDEIAQRYYVSVVGIRELVKLGMEVGSHTDTHPMLTNIPLFQADREIGLSTVALYGATFTGTKSLGPRSFCWPYGMWECDDQNKLFDLVRSTGYTSGWGYHALPVLVREDPRWAIARIDESAFEMALGIPPLS